MEAHGIDLVIDVGANTGQFAENLRRGGYRGRIVSFEPLGKAFRALARTAEPDPMWECHHVALSDRNGSAELHVARNSESSSLLEMEAQHVASAPESRFVGTEVIETVRLDALEIASEGARVLLKIDVQGLELEVMDGAAERLGETELIECELSVVPLYRDQPLLPDVVDYLSQRGFALINLEPVFHDPDSGRILQLDGTFARSRSGVSTGWGGGRG